MKAIARVILVAALACGMGCARSDWIDRTLLTVDVTGIWGGTMTGGGPSEFYLDLAQQGPHVKGTVRGTRLNRSGRQIEGTVTGDVFTFGMPDAPFAGEMKVNEDEMTGLVTVPLSSARAVLTLRRIGSSSPPSSPRQ